MISLFSKHGGIKGLADSLFSGVAGSVFRCVGVDYRSKPGIFKAHQKLVRHSPAGSEGDIDEICNAAVNVSDGSNLWFSSESGKIWREVDGVYDLVHTLNVDDFPLNSVPFRVIVDISSTVPTMFFSSRLKPEDAGVYVEPTVSASNTGESSTSSISVDIEIPDEPNQVVIVMGGVYTQFVQDNITGSTVGGDAATFVNSISLADEFGLGMSAKLFRYLNPTPGNNTVVVNFSEGYENRFIAVLVFKNVNQTTPIDKINGGFAGNSAQFNLSEEQDTYGQGFYTFIITPPATHTVNEDETEGVTNLLTFTNPTVNNRVSAFFAEGFEYTSDNKITDAEEFEDNENTFVYFSTKEHLWKVPLDNVDLFDELELAGIFKNGTTEHPMTKQNLSLFIGDKNVIASVDDTGAFNKETLLNVPKWETITALVNFDTDLLVGTLDRTIGRVLRWDTVSESWSAQDEVFEKGVTAFIRDDNYVYVVAGNIGRIYFYNGERMEPFVRIPGEWSNQKLATIHRNSTGFYLGVPIFGLTNVSGNPQLQGIYGLGSYGRNYAKTLSLDFPVPTDEFEGVSIGAIIVDDVDLYVSWKDGTDVGIAKLDWTKKYAGYLETTALSGSEDRHLIKTLTKAVVPHLPLPENTGITLGYKKKYEASFTDMPTKEDEDRMMTYNRNSVPKVANLQLRVGLQVNGNDTPSCEDLLVDMKTPE